MNLNSLRLLYSYNAWANARILLAVDQLTDMELKRQPVAGLGALRDILVHTLGAQWIWLSRWRGESPDHQLDPHDFPNLEALRMRWTQVEGETQAFVHGLNEAAMHREIHYTSLSGRPFNEPLWQLMMHQVNHATQHRSESAVLLTLFNYSPGDLDLILYLRLVKEGAEAGGYETA